jgi:carbonic anhydrase
MAALPELLEANRRYAAGFTKGSLQTPPRLHVAILTCMDARLDPARMLGLEEGDAHVIRNAGGRPTEDAIRSLVISQLLLGTREVVVIHHVECGMLSFSNDDLRQKIRADLGADASNIDFLPFSDLAQSVRDDVAELRRSPLLLKDAPISGFIYDVKSGRLLPVE